MNRKIIISLIVCVLVCTAGFGAYHFFFSSGVVQPSKIAEAASPSTYVVPPLTAPYQNDSYKFSLSMPADFAAKEVDNQDGSHTIALENEKGDGLQITITPFDEDLHALTVERIKQDVPDMAVTDPQTVEIGANDTGVAFKSDNKAFDGASRDVWFVFRGNLYQISTYERLDPLLVAIFGTWKFY